MKKAILFGLAVILVFSGVFGGLMWGLKPEEKEFENNEYNFESGLLIVALSPPLSATSNDYSSDFLKIEGVAFVEEEPYRNYNSWIVANEYWQMKKISQEAANGVWERNLQKNQDQQSSIHPEEYMRFYWVYLENQSSHKHTLQLKEKLEVLDWVVSADLNYIFNITD